MSVATSREQSWRTFAGNNIKRRLARLHKASAVATVNSNEQNLFRSLISLLPTMVEVALWQRTPSEIVGKYADPMLRIQACGPHPHLFKTDENRATCAGYLPDEVLTGQLWGTQSMTEWIKMAKWWIGSLRGFKIYDIVHHFPWIGPWEIPAGSG